jgi:hypothetical protein
VSSSYGLVVNLQHIYALGTFEVEKGASKEYAQLEMQLACRTAASRSSSLPSSQHLLHRVVTHLLRISLSAESMLEAVWS